MAATAVVTAAVTAMAAGAVTGVGAADAAMVGGTGVASSVGAALSVAMAGGAGAVANAGTATGAAMVGGVGTATHVRAAGKVGAATGAAMVGGAREATLVRAAAVAGTAANPGATADAGALSRVAVGGGGLGAGVGAQVGGGAAAAAGVGGEGADVVRPASHPRWDDAVTEPVRGINRFPHSFDGGRPAPAPGHGGRTANQTSTNWAGYAVTGGTYTSVSASWIEPSVTCTSDGIVAFWIGLDGWGSTSVEQDGTGVDCTNGTPQQFAWWETFPANSIQEYNDPVSAGDHLTSTVTSEPGGIYNLVLTDSTKGWTERNPARVTGAQNTSAEVVAEAVTSGDDITPLPDFHAIDFTSADIDGSPVQTSGAQPIDMTDGAGAALAATQHADVSGDFLVSYTGPTTPAAVAPTPTKSTKPAPTEPGTGTKPPQPGTEPQPGTGPQPKPQPQPTQVPVTQTTQPKPGATQPGMGTQGPKPGTGTQGPAPQPSTTVTKVPVPAPGVTKEPGTSPGTVPSTPSTPSVPRTPSTPSTPSTKSTMSTKGTTSP